MTKFAAFECRQALKLFHDTVDSFGAYLPVERIIRICPKTKRKSVTERAAMAGMIFVPYRKAPEFRRKVPRWHQLRQLVYPLSQHPKLVTLDELTRMQRILNEEFTDPTGEQQVRQWFERNDRVEVTGMPLFEGTKGTVERCKSDGRIRILTDAGQFIEISALLLKKIKVS